VPTFVPCGVLARYKCVGLTFVPGGTTNRYKCEAFVPGGLDQAPTSLCERTFVPVGGSNRYKCHHLYRWQKYPVQIKNMPGIYVGKKKRYLGNENHRRLYWRDPRVHNSPKEKPPGSPRTFSTVPNRQPSRQATTALVPFLFPFSLLLSFVPSV
jgi:hypothetical protein